MMVDMNLRRKIVVTFYVLLLLVIAIIGVTTWYARSNPRGFAQNKRDLVSALGLAKEGEGANVPPEELTGKRDPAVSQATFSIVSFDQIEQTLTLTYMYPESRAGEQVVSRIVCDEGDYQIGIGKEKPKKVTRGEFWEKIIGREGEMMVLSGLCGDSECREMISECYLYLPGVRAL
jgi:hypothetical protein